MTVGDRSRVTRGMTRRAMCAGTASRDRQTSQHRARLQRYFSRTVQQATTATRPLGSWTVMRTPYIDAGRKIVTSTTLRRESLFSAAKATRPSPPPGRLSSRAWTKTCTDTRANHLRYITRRVSHSTRGSLRSDPIDSPPPTPPHGTRGETPPPTFHRRPKALSRELGVDSLHLRRLGLRLDAHDAAAPLAVSLREAVVVRTLDRPTSLENSSCPRS